MIAKKFGEVSGKGGKRALLWVALRYRMYEAIEKQREGERETISVAGEGTRLHFTEQGVTFPVTVRSQHPSA